MEADDHHGARTSTTLHLQSRSGEDQVLLRTAHSVYKPGGHIDLDVLSTRQRGTAYIDVVKDGQTILTRDVDLASGQANLSLSITPEMSGTLSIDAYVFGANAQPVADHRLVFVQPADELHIKTIAEATSYQPGADAHIRFHVTNARGDGVSAALGLEVVDEAVFALADKQPGFAKIFFYLEQELLKPRYEIHSLSRDTIVLSATESENDPHDRAARVLFAAAESLSGHTVDTEVGREFPQTHTAEYTQRYRDIFNDYVSDLAHKLTVALEQRKGEAFEQIFVHLKDDSGAKPHDAWGAPLRLERIAWSRRTTQNYQVISASPDRYFDTADDLAITIEAHAGTVFGSANSGKIDLHIEHDRGAFNGFAQVAGTVTDASGTVIPHAGIVLRGVGGDVRRITISVEQGNYSFAGIPAGRYELHIDCSGFGRASRQFDVVPRGLATINAWLTVGSTSETVEVLAEDAVVALPVQNRAVVHGNFLRDGIDKSVQLQAAAPMAEIAGGTGMALARSSVAKTPASLGQPLEAEPHVRSFFPEALYINPEILTNGHGNASISIPMADSITTWRMAMFASTKNGALGSSSSSLKVFQDFFVDLDLPVTITKGNRISIPVAVYNYTPGKGQVSLKLQPEEWYSLIEDFPEKSVSVDSGAVGGSQYTLEARHIGKFKLTLSARMVSCSSREDIVVREIEVVSQRSSGGDRL